ncbi:MAG TPA: VOC family protein [Thermomicrobiales bacterium]|nr:VOC family protein [Thermomicrobiales bacterium]
MKVFIGSIVVNTNDMERAIAFWTEALGYVVRSGDKTFTVLHDPNRRWAYLSLQLTNEIKFSRNRLHLDLFTDDQAGEIARLEGLGAERIPWNYPEEDDFVVMADPDGNEFCVIQNQVSQDA